MPPSYATLLKDVGFNVLNVANNHSRDFGPAGFKETVQSIKSVGLTAIGEKGEIVYKKVKNYINGKEIVKKIVVKNRIVNIIVK